MLPKKTTATFPHFPIIMSLNESRQINQEHEHSYTWSTAEENIYVFSFNFEYVFYTVKSCVCWQIRGESSSLVCFFISSPFTLSRRTFSALGGGGGRGCVRTHRTPSAYAPGRDYMYEKFWSSQKRTQSYHPRPMRVKWKVLNISVSSRGNKRRTTN